jgi:proline utilization trans-activator
MASASVRESLPLAQDEMPSREYAKYLAETVLFHLGDIYHVFDKESFMEMLNAFYDHNQPLKHLWHMQLLLVIAFGKLFLRRGASSLGPPGAADFLRALRLQPDVLDLWDDPILRIEVLCLITLYLNTADMRPTAYTFVSIPSPSLIPPSRPNGLLLDWSSSANCTLFRYESRSASRLP